MYGYILLRYEDRFMHRLPDRTKDDKRRVLLGLARRLSENCHMKQV